MMETPFVKRGDLVATQGHPYRKADFQVQASPYSLPACFLGTVAGPGPPPWAWHGAVAVPCARQWPQDVGILLGPRPLCAPLTTEDACGLGLPARFFLEIEGVFISSRFFLENMVEPVPEALNEDGRPAGVSTLWLLVLAVSGPHCSGPPLLSCQTHVTGLALIGGKSPTQEKAPVEGGR